MSAPANREFCVGIARVTGVIGIDRQGSSGTPLFETLIRKEGVKWIGGRSAGSAAALGATTGSLGVGITHLVLLSYPFGPSYRSSVLSRIPKQIKILFIIGDNDRLGRQNAQGKSSDNSYAHLDATIGKTHRISKILLRHCSHGTKVEPEFGGDAARDAILNLAGETAARWLVEDGEGEGEGREGGIYWDGEKAVWTGWKGKFGLRQADKLGF